MADLRLAPDPEPETYNKEPLNQAAKRLLRKTEAGADQHGGAYLLQLAQWGLDRDVPVPNLDPARRGPLEVQVGKLLARKDQSRAVAFLTSNPDGDDPAQQQRDLLGNLEAAESPEQAAALVLETMLDRLQADGAPDFQRPQALAL